MGTLAFAAVLLILAFGLRFFLKKKGIVNPAPTTRADYFTALKILGLVPLFTMIIVGGYFLKWRLDTRIWPVATVFFKENGRQYGMVMERVKSPTLHVRVRRSRAALPASEEFQFKIFDLSSMKEISSLKPRIFFRTDLRPADFVTYLGRSGWILWIESDTQGLVAVDSKTLEVIDEEEIAVRNPSVPLPRVAYRKRGFDWIREKPFLYIALDAYIVNPIDFTLSKFVEPIPIPNDSNPAFDCVGRKLTERFEFETENKNGKVYLRVLDSGHSARQILIEHVLQADHVAGVCLDDDSSLYVLVATGDTFPAYQPLRLNLH